MPQIGVQLYSVRDAFQNDYESTLSRLHQMGFDGVETAGLPSQGVDAVGETLYSMPSFSVLSMHMGALLNEDAGVRSAAVHDAVRLGSPYVVIPYIPADQFTTLEAVHQVCDRINAALPQAQAEQRTLLYHNHDWEFRTSDALGGRTPFDIMRERLDPAIGFEIDVYWVQHAGQDPASVVASLGTRAPILHMKDGHPGTDQAMLAAGDGDVNFEAILGASTADLWIVELDRFDGDMFHAVERSLGYLRSLLG